MRPIKPILTIAFIIWSYYLVYAFYQGLIVNPILELGDGYDYHLPIAQTILDGRFLHPVDFKLPQWYYPGSGQLFNSLFLLLNIPITISNPIAMILLFFVCVKLALTFRLKYYLALLFGITVVTVNAVLRWNNDMSLDVLVAVFFIYAITLLEKPKNRYTYFLKLGFIFGMLIGSKYSACLLVILLLVIYGKKLISFLTFPRLIAFLIPFSIFGLFWYVRNFIYTGNPFYPLPIFGLPGTDIFGGHNILNVTLHYPLTMLNAVFSEYHIWTILIMLTAGFYLFKKFRSGLHILGMDRLLLLGFVNLILYLIYPTSTQPWIMVSSLRYSYPAFIPLILCVFVFTAYYKKEMLLGFITIGSMLMVLSMAYYPKLILIYIPLGLFAQYLFDKYEKQITSRQK